MTTELTTVTTRLGLQPGMIVMEMGHGDDADEELREAIAETTGTQLVDEDYDDGQVDAVLLWFRDGDGDFTDALLDTRTYVKDDGAVLLLTPESGRSGHIEPSEISEAALAAGLQLKSSHNAAQDWTASRLLHPKAAK
ncbi:DUF3052 domain-containing protein [Streptomyces sp. 5.8]|uniref:DUF3052 domain-containing protein n=1 Tax=Streptomyces sp. 5.8 TaxID=3406571 RepID=UPI003BB59DEA